MPVLLPEYHTARGESSCGCAVSLQGWLRLAGGETSWQAAAAIFGALWSGWEAGNAFLRDWCCASGEVVRKEEVGEENTLISLNLQLHIHYRNGCGLRVQTAEISVDVNKMYLPLHLCLCLLHREAYWGWVFLPHSDCVWDTLGFFSSKASSQVSE